MSRIAARPGAAGDIVPACASLRRAAYGLALADRRSLDVHCTNLQCCYAQLALHGGVEGNSVALSSFVQVTSSRPWRSGAAFIPPECCRPNRARRTSSRGGLLRCASGFSQAGSSWPSRSSLRIATVGSRSAIQGFESQPRRCRSARTAAGAQCTAQTVAAQD